MTDLSKQDSDRIIGAGQSDRKPGKLTTQEEALNFLEEALEHARAKRRQCDVVVPDNPGATVRMQKQAFQTYLLALGRSMGAAEALFRVGTIEEKAWKEFHQKTLNTLATTVMGVV